MDKEDIIAINDRIFEVYRFETRFCEPKDARQLSLLAEDLHKELHSVPYSTEQRKIITDYFRSTAFFFHAGMKLKRKNALTIFKHMTDEERDFYKERLGNDKYLIVGIGAVAPLIPIKYRSGKKLIQKKTWFLSNIYTAPFFRRRFYVMQSILDFLNTHFKYKNELVYCATETPVLEKILKEEFKYKKVGDECMTCNLFDEKKCKDIPIYFKKIK